MEKIGKLIINDELSIVKLRKKIKAIANMLSFTETEATRMALLISEASSQILTTVPSFDITVSLKREGNAGIAFTFSSTKKLPIFKNEAARSFFDSISTNDEKERNKEVSFQKKIPVHSIVIDAPLVSKLRLELLKKSEDELLKELATKNTELSKKNKKLKVQEELLSRAQQLANLGGWEFDTKTKSISWTTEVFHIHELPQERQPSLEESLTFYTDEAKPVIVKAIDDAIALGTGWDLELQIVTALGNTRWIRTIGYPKRVKNKTVNISGVYQDITYRKEAELQLENNNLVLAAKNKELQQFAYIASHDLQEPLRTITSFAEVLIEDYGDKLDGEGQENLEFISEATGRMQALIKGLLDYTRIGSTKELVDIDCNQLVADVRQDLVSIIEQSTPSFDIQKLPVIKGNPTDLRLLFQNLISNAIKFRKKSEPLIIKIFAKKEGGYWKFTLQDNGIGIDPQYQDKIFAIFHRLHTADEYQGTGIGLAHCNKIVEQHFGKIWVTSQLGVGSAFHFTIPIHYK